MIQNSREANNLILRASGSGTKNPAEKAAEVAEDQVAILEDVPEELAELNRKMEGATFVGAI